MFSDGGHSNLLCTVEFGEQTLNSEDRHLTDTANGYVDLKGTVTDIDAIHFGPACGVGSTEEATYHVNLALSGENEKGGDTDIGLSHEEA